MAIQIYKDTNVVTVYNTVRQTSLNLAQDEDVVATVNSSDSNAIDVRIGPSVASDSDVKLFFGVDHTLFQDESGAALGANASATATAINDIFDAHVSRGTFRGILLGESDAQSIGVGSGTIKFQVGDTFVNFGNVKGYYIVDTAFDFTKQANVTQALLHYNTHASKVTKVAVSGDAKLVDLDPTTSSDEFTETMSTFQLTTSNSTTFIPGTSGLIIAGNTTTTGNLTSTGTPTLSGIQYPTSDGTADQVIKTDGSGTLSFTNLPADVTQSVVYARMSMSSAVLRGGASQQDYNGTTDVVVKFDTEDETNGSGLTTDTSNNRITVSDSGYYRLTVNMSFFSSSARATPSVRFNVNGTSIPGDANGYIRASTGQNESTVNYTRLINLSANDYVGVFCHDDSSSNGAIYADVGLFEVERVNGVQGPAGDDGADGADGQDGINGTNGTNGTNGADGADGLGFTGGSYNASTGVVTFTSDDGLGFVTGDLRGADGADGADGSNGSNGANGTDGTDGLGFTGGSYNASTGIVTFTSDDGLGFSTSDLRGADGADGSDGADGAPGINGTNGTNGTDGDGFTGGSYNASTGVVTFTSDDGLGFSTGDLRGTDGSDGADGAPGPSSNVFTFHDAGRRQFSSSQDNYYHVGDFTYGLSDNNKNGALSSYTTGSLVSNLIDDFHINSFVVPANCTSAAIRGSLHTNSSALVENDIDVYVYKLVPNSTTNAYRHTATEVLNVTVTMPENTRRVIAFNVDASNLSLSAGDYLHVVYKPNGVSTGSTHYLFYSHTLTITE